METTTTTTADSTTSTEATTATTTRADGEATTSTAGSSVISDATTTTDTAGAGPSLAATADEQATEAFTSLAEAQVSIAEPAAVETGLGLFPLSAVAGVVALISISVALLAVMTPLGRLSKVRAVASGAVNYLLVSLVGVAAALALVEASRWLTAESVALNYGVPTVEGATVWTAGLAATVAPAIPVMFKAGAVLVGVLIAALPLAAALTARPGWSAALSSVGAVLVANIIWPPLAAVCVAQAFSALPDGGAAAWWLIAALITIPLAHLLTLRSARHYVRYNH